MNQLERSEFAKASRNSAGKAFLYTSHIAMLIRMNGDKEFIANLSATRREHVMDLMEYGLMEMNEYRAVTTSQKGIDMLQELCTEMNLKLANGFGEFIEAERK